MQNFMHYRNAVFGTLYSLLFDWKKCSLIYYGVHLVGLGHSIAVYNTAAPELYSAKQFVKGLSKG